MLFDAEQNTTLKNRIDTLYSFYLFIQPEESSKRIKNFIDEKYIDDVIGDADKWADDWGITLKILVKIILQALKFEKEEYEDITYLTKGLTKISFVFDEPEEPTIIKINTSNILRKVFGYYNIKSIPQTYKFSWNLNDWENTLQNIVYPEVMNTEFEISRDKSTLFQCLTIVGDMRHIINSSNSSLNNLYYQAMSINGKDIVGNVFVLKDKENNPENLPRSILMEYQTADKVYE